MKTKSEIDDFELTPKLKKMILFASGGPFLDGYILVIIGVALTQIEPELGITSQQSALIGVAALVGLFLGTSIFGYLTDKIGRKKMFTLDIIAIGVISILTMFVSTAFGLLVMRFLIGVAIGADYPIATSLVAEFTPKKYRAISMGFIAAVWYLGATAANLVGYALYDVDGGWRLMLGSAVIPCIILLLGRMHTPESPRWLAKMGRTEEANAVVKEVFGREAVIETEVVSKVSYSVLFKKGYFSRVIFVGTIWACQVAPMFALYTFGPMIMASFGFGGGKEALLGDIIISCFFVAGCIPAMFWLDSMGRRFLLIGSFAIMTVSLVFLGLFPDAPVGVITIAFATYAFFSGGPGILEWLYPNELFPTEIRASAVGAAMAFSRIGTIISVYLTPIFLDKFGIGPTMMAAAAITLLGLIVSIFMAPETRGMSLEESSKL